jgi:hypothetical protein
MSDEKQPIQRWMKKKPFNLKSHAFITHRCCPHPLALTPAVD